MRSIFPSVEIMLPEEWSLRTATGSLLCQKPHLWVEHKQQLVEESSLSQDPKTSSNGPALQGVMLRFQGDQSTWDAIMKKGLMGYAEERAGPIFGGSFDPQAPFVFEAILCSSQLTLLSLMIHNESNLRDHFISSSISAEMQNEASYRLHSVTQALPKNPRVQIGLTMHWD